MRGVKTSESCENQKNLAHLHLWIFFSFFFVVAERRNLHTYIFYSQFERGGPVRFTLLKIISLPHVQEKL